MPPGRCDMADGLADDGVADGGRVELTGVPETMLWPLHHRAAEARRPDGLLRDPDCLRIHDAIDYDFARSFGPANGTLGGRARRFDDELRPWIAAQRGGVVVELGAGLETQFCRVDDGRVTWFCVDVPEAIDVRERFLPETERCHHVRRSALDLAWFDDVEQHRNAESPVFVTAQGLLMYLRPADVQRLVAAIFEHFPEVTFMFDAIPPWVSRASRRGIRITPYYVTPPMPWGIRASEVESTLRRWCPDVGTVRVEPFGVPRGPAKGVLESVGRLPLVNRTIPIIVVAERRSA